mmetsp:Transcript_19024/g.61977  ORF Transcript_19024/g.61977 Transcript_19024/m.61977 type:complete len:107 (-) Transcript_19024:496-816(-)
MPTSTSLFLIGYFWWSLLQSRVLPEGSSATISRVSRLTFHTKAFPGGSAHSEEDRRTTSRMELNGVLRAPSASDEEMTQHLVGEHTIDEQQAEGDAHNADDLGSPL